MIGGCEIKANYQNVIDLVTPAYVGTFEKAVYFETEKTGKWAENNDFLLHGTINEKSSRVL